MARRGKERKKFTIDDYWRFLKGINETEVVSYDKYLIDAEMNLLAKAYKLNMIIVPNNLEHAAPKHYFYGDREERIVFVRHVGVHYDVLLLDENSVYLESALIERKSYKISGKIEGIKSTRNYTTEEFWKMNNEVLMGHEYLQEEEEACDNKVKGGSKDWTEEMSSYCQVQGYVYIFYKYQNYDL